MSEKNFMAYGDAETILTGFASDIKSKQPITLTTPIIIGGIQYYTVESTLNALKNVSGGGMSAMILVTANAGSTVTITTPSGSVITASQVSGTTDKWVGYTNEYGVHTVISLHEGQTRTETVNVTVCQIYDIEAISYKTFAAATDVEIAEMVTKADQGKIDLYEDCGWRVGQYHDISISAITASGTFEGVTWNVNETHAAQTLRMVLLHGDKGTTPDGGLPTLVTPVLNKGGTTRNIPSFVYGFTCCLAEKGYLHPSNLSNGWTWRDVDRRNWCNGAFRGALPSSIRSVSKQFNVITAEKYNATTNVTTQDYFTFAAEKEINGERALSAEVEANALTKFSYYTNNASRVKTLGMTGSATMYADRSPGTDNFFEVCMVSDSGYRNAYNNLNTQMGLSPIGVL